jgi:predicted peptidase
MITLHGAGERGTDNAVQLTHDFNKHWAADSVQKVRPLFVVAPQCPPDNKWADVDWAKGSYKQDDVPISDELKAVVDILDSLEREFTLDLNRIYVSGLSMGGYGTWDLIARYPQRFAAAIPVCGGGDPTKAASLSKLPLWVFHAADDNVVPVSGSRDMVNALKAVNGKVQYDEYPANLKIGHASWVPAGNDPRLVPWLLAQSRTPHTLGSPVRVASRGVVPGLIRDSRTGRMLALRNPGDPFRVDASGRFVLPE